MGPRGWDLLSLAPMHLGLWPYGGCCVAQVLLACCMRKLLVFSLLASPAFVLLSLHCALTPNSQAQDHEPRILGTSKVSVYIIITRWTLLLLHISMMLFSQRSAILKCNPNSHWAASMTSSGRSSLMSFMGKQHVPVNWDNNLLLLCTTN